MVYLLGTITSVFLALFVSKDNLKKKRLDLEKLFNYIFAFLSFVPLFVISAMRYDVGTDYFYGYVPIFKAVLNGDIRYYADMEPGYIWINKLLVAITSDYQWIFVVTSLMIVGLAFISIYQFSDNYVLSIILFVLSYTYFNSFNIVRQQIAVMIVLYATKYLNSENGEKKQKCIKSLKYEYNSSSRVMKGKLKFIFLVLIATMFHKVAIIGLLLAFLVEIDLNVFTTGICIGIIILIRKFISSLLPIIATVIPRLNNYLVANRGDTFGKTTAKIIIAMNVIIMLIIFIINHRNSETTNNQSFRLVKWIYFLIFSFMILDTIIPHASRFQLFYTALTPIYITNAIMSESNKRVRNFLSFLILIAYSFGFAFYYITGFGEVFPYQTIFSK